MKLKITFLTLAAAALTASAAFAAPPAGKGKPATSPSSTHPATPTVMFVLHGTITAYTAVNGATNGSVTISLTGWNRGTFTKGQSLTFVVGPSSKVVGTPTVTHKATLKWRAAKAPTTAAPAGAVAQLIGQAASS